MAGFSINTVAIVYVEKNEIGHVFHLISKIYYLFT